MFCLSCQYFQPKHARSLSSVSTVPQASKLLYRLSKDTANDAVFRREKLLEPLIRTVGGWMSLFQLLRIDSVGFDRGAE